MNILFKVCQPRHTVVVGHLLSMCEAWVQSLITHTHTHLFRLKICYLFFSPVLLRDWNLCYETHA